MPNRAPQSLIAGERKSVVEDKHKSVIDKSERLLLDQSTLLVFAVAALALFLVMPRDLIIFDEGLILSGAMRALEMEVVHRDFYSPYGPAQFYVVAELFRLFGKSFLVERLYDTAVKAGVLAVLFRIMSARCRLRSAVAFTTICTMYFIGLGAFLYPIFPCLFLALVGSSLILNAPESLNVVPTRSFAAGVCAGVTVLFRYDVGFFLVVANLFAILLVRIGRGKDLRGFRDIFAQSVAYLVGTTLICGPAAIVAVALSSVSSFIDDIVVYPSTYYAKMRGLPFPNLHALRANPAGLSVYIPFLSIASLLSEAIRRRVVDRHLHLSPLHEAAWRNAPNSATVVVFGSLASFFFCKGLVRVSAIQTIIAVVPSLIVIAVLLDRWRQRGILPRFAAVAVIILVSAPAISAAKRELQDSFYHPGRSMAGWLAADSIVSAIDLSCRSADASGIARLPADYARAANFLEHHTQPNERIFIGLDRHDKIYANAPGLYFAAGRLPGTHWHQFDPGLQTWADIQTAIIGDLEVNKVKWIVRDASLDDVNEPNGSAQSSGVTLLDNFIVENYRPVAAAGKVEIWLAKTQPRPVALSTQAACEATPIP